MEFRPDVRGGRGTATTFIAARRSPGAATQHPALESPGLLELPDAGAGNTHPQQSEELQRARSTRIPAQLRWISSLQWLRFNRDEGRVGNHRRSAPRARFYRSEEKPRDYCWNQVLPRAVRVAMPRRCITMIAGAGLRLRAHARPCGSRGPGAGLHRRRQGRRTEFPLFLFQAASTAIRCCSPLRATSRTPIVFYCQQALALGAYTDQAAEGRSDYWDTFMRFMLAQFVPVHIPEKTGNTKSWRMHAASTAGNI